MKKPLAIVSMLLIMALAGCGSSSSSSQPSSSPAPAPAAKAPESVTITFWHTYSTDSPENKALVEQVIPAFQKKYPNITVKAVVYPYEGLHDKLVTGVAGGNVPDVMRMDIIWVPEFAKMGALQAVDGMQGFSDIKSKVFAGPLATNAYKGKFYGVPLDTNTQVMIYNQDVLKAAGFAAPPATIDEFVKYMQAATGNGKFAFAQSGTNPWTMLPLFWTLGGSVTNPDYTKATGFLNSDASVKALSTLKDWFKGGAPSLLGGQPDTWGGFKAGTYGAIQDGPWAFAALQPDLKDKMVGAPIPKGPAGSISVVGGEDIVMFANSQHKNEAWTFIQYMLSDEAQQIMAKVGQMPVTQSASGSDAVKQTAYYAPYVTQLATAQPRTPVPAWTQMEKIIADAFESVFRDKATPQDALTKAAQQIDPLLQG